MEYDPRGYCVCTSEGKDSRVLGHLMRRAGVKHFYAHNITGIDPPELIYFQRRNFQEYRDAGYLTYDIMPRISFWKLMEKNKIPPLRYARYCCKELKEREKEETRGCIMSLGVRKAESTSRAKNRAELEAGTRKNGGVLMPYDNENRLAFESCQTSGQRRVNPIVMWTDAMIWDYSKDAHLKQCCLYGEGFDRLGCIGCPMGRRVGREHAFKRWPKFKALYLRTFEKMLEEINPSTKTLYLYMSSAESWFDWWMSDKAQEQTDENQMEIAYDDYI